MKLFVPRKRVKVDEIKVPKSFETCPPKPEKLIIKTAEYINTGVIGQITVDEDCNLIDGYCSYLIIKALGIESYKCVMIKIKKRRKE